MSLVEPCDALALVELPPLALAGELVELVELPPLVEDLDALALVIDDPLTLIDDPMTLPEDGRLPLAGELVELVELVELPAGEPLEAEGPEPLALADANEDPEPASEPAEALPMDGLAEPDRLPLPPEALADPVDTAELPDGTIDPPEELPPAELPSVLPPEDD